MGKSRKLSESYILDKIFRVRQNYVLLACLVLQLMQMVSVNTLLLIFYLAARPDLL